MYKIKTSRTRIFIAFIMGSISALSFAPTYLFFILFFSFPTLLFLLSNSKSLKESFFLGWGFGFGFFLCGLYWISYALLVEQDMFGWLIPFAVTLIPAVLALYIGFITVLLHRIRKDTISITISFVSLWVLVEMLRTKLFTGFPWLTLGYSLSNKITLIQSASLFGVFGLSFVVLVIALTPFVLFKKYKKSKFVSIFYTTCAISIFTLNFMYGAWRLDNADREFLPHSVRVVQPNIKQSIKWDNSYRSKNLRKIMALSSKGGNESQTYIIWPEAAVTYFLDDKNTRDVIKETIPEKSYLITGGTRISRTGDLKIMTSLFVIGSDGEIVDYYDKMHLVPFGEYIPLRNFIPFNISKLTHGLLDFTEGKIVKIITPKEGYPSFRGLICYESFFPQETLFDNQRPNFLVNITNDAWYRNSPGPYHHLDITKFRAIEYGIPMVRAANTGISAMINQYGEILQQLDLDQEGYFVYKLPKCQKSKTLYNLYDNNIIIFLLTITLFGVFIRYKLMVTKVQ